MDPCSGSLQCFIQSIIHATIATDRDNVLWNNSQPYWQLSVLTSLFNSESKTGNEATCTLFAISYFTNENSVY